jgi:hypothetical protein
LRVLDGLDNQLPHRLLSIWWLLVEVVAAKIMVVAVGLEGFVQRLALQLALAHQSQ